MSRRTRHDSDDDHGFEGPSKSQLKREMEDLQNLGVALLDLPMSQFEALDLDERMRDALEQLRRLHGQHGARKRQAQYVGKLMRNADVEPLRRAIAERNAVLVSEVRALKAVEQWRERLLTEANALQAWVQQHPHCDTPEFRSVVAQARREYAAKIAGNASTPRHTRELFKLLRDAMGVSAESQAAR